MNILHITTFLQGGAGRIITTLMIEEKKRGHEVFLICTDTEEPGYCNYPEYLEKLKNNNIRIYRIDSTFKRDIYLNFNAIKLTKEIIKNNKIDIIHAYAAVPAFVGLNATSGMREIPVIQNMFGWGTNKTVQQENMDITIMNSIKRIVTDSKSSKKLLVDKGVKKEKIAVIYDSIIEERINENNDKDLLEIIQLKKNGYKIIGCVGTISKNKNQVLLIEAFNKYNRLYNGAICIFIGEGELVEELKDKCSKYGIEKKVRFYGYKKSAIRYMKYFDCLVLPSLSEGAPVSIVEAFKEKVMTLGSDIDSIDELICNGETGFLFENNDINDLYSKLRNVLELDDVIKSKIAENAYFKNKFRFDVNRMIDEYIELYINEISLKGDKFV